MAYRSFARKHEMTRANLRRKTALLRVLESRLDKREDSLHDLHERSQEKVTAGLSGRKTRKKKNPNGLYKYRWRFYYIYFHSSLAVCVFSSGMGMPGVAFMYVL